ncbi:MAG: CHASE3 domain-containing protein [Nitrospira sp.]|jgi:PAS domain S-box-containing protein|nr:ATP-binding protein [Nitrospira sp. BO4]
MQERFPQKFLDDLPILPKLLLIPTIPFISLMIFSVMTYLDVQNFIQDEERLTRLYLLQKTAAQYMRSVADLETAFLGYVISENNRYLARFQEGRKNVLEMDRQLETQHPQQHEQFEDIRALVEKSFFEKEALLQAIQLGNRSDAIKYVRDGRSREIMVEVRKWMAWFDREQDRMQQLELSRLSYDRAWTRFLILGGGLVTLCLVIFALALIARSIATPVTALSKVVGSTAGQAIPSIPVLDRKDEIGVLTTVMKKMSLQIRKDLEEVQQSEATLKRLNAHLSASEAKYRGLVDHAPLGIFMTKGVRVTFSNRYNQQLAGLDPESNLDPETFRQRVHPEDRDRVLTTFSEAVAAGRPCELIFRLLHDDGSIRTVLSQRVPIMDLESPDVVYVGFNIDITTLDNLQLRLRRAEKLATLGQVAAGIAHELRNPLVGIGSTAKVLLDDFESDDPKRKEIEVILSETRRLDRIVNQIVDYARPRRLAPTRIDLNRLVGEVSKLLKSRLEDKHLTIKISISPMISEFTADRDLLRQVLLNIVDNAIDASPKGGAPIEITGHELFREERPGLVIQVKDDGVGISPELLPNVFQPFVTSGKKHGTGLGLAICQNIVESHEGDIYVTSEVGKGTIVGIWLPLEQETALERL